MKISEVMDLLHAEGYACELFGDPDCVVDGFADPSEYRDGAIIWLGDIKYLTLQDDQGYSDIALLLCKDDFMEKDLFPNVLVCEDPRNAFVRLLELSQEEDELIGVDLSAVIDPSAVIGQDVYIAPNCVIGKDVVIGDNCKIMPGAYIEHTIMGNNCIIYPNCVIGVAGFGFRKDSALVMEPHVGKVVLGDNIEILSGSVIERGSTKNTTIGRGTKLACLTNVGHNVTVGEDCQIIGGILNGFANIGDRSELIRCVVGNRIKIGKDTKIGLNSTVVRDIPDNVVAFGSPARIKSSGGGATKLKAITFRRSLPDCSREYFLCA